MSDRPFPAVIAVPATLLARCCRLRGWDKAKSQAVLSAYRQFMVLKVQHEDWSASILSPPEEIDFMWHQHILDVQNYVTACTEYCGHLIGHDPDGALDGVARQKRIATTKISRTARFGPIRYSSHNAAIWSFVEEENENEEEGEETNNKKKKKRSREEESPEEEPPVPPPPMRNVHARTAAPAVSSRVVSGGEDSSDERQIIIRVRDTSGEVTHCRLLRTTRMKKLMDIYARRRGVSRQSLRFLFDANKIGDDDTPTTMELADGGEIDVVAEQCGC
jgi:small ubiquitin-related modifier